MNNRCLLKYYLALCMVQCYLFFFGNLLFFINFEVFILQSTLKEKRKNKQTNKQILLLTIPPRQPPRQVLPFGPGVGNCLKQSCPGGREWVE